RAIGLDHLAAAGDDGDSGDAVLDLAVLRRQLTGGARREPAADRRAVDRRREVTERVAAAIELALEPLAVEAGFDVAHELVGAHRPHLLHALRVDRDPAEQRDRDAAHAGPTSIRHDRN